MMLCSELFCHMAREDGLVIRRLLERDGQRDEILGMNGTRQTDQSGGINSSAQKYPQRNIADQMLFDRCSQQRAGPGDSLRM